MTELHHGDPTMHDYWGATRRHELSAQRCEDCGVWQFYARPFCLACLSDAVRWRPTAGTGVVYTITTVHRKIVPHLEPPYAVGVVELDEGPRLLTNFLGEPCRIGDRVKVLWREREGGLPPVPVFELVR